MNLCSNFVSVASLWIPVLLVQCTDLASFVCMDQTFLVKIKAQRVKKKSRKTETKKNPNNNKPKNPQQQPPKPNPTKAKYMKGKRAGTKVSTGETESQT